MNFQEMLMQLLMGQAKDPSRLWAGGPAMGLPPGGSTMPQPMQMPGNITEMPKTMPSVGPLPPKDPSRMMPDMAGGMPQGFGLSGATPPPEMPPPMPGNPGMMGFMPPGGPMGLGQPPAPPPAPAAAPPPGPGPQINAGMGGGFGNKAMGLFGGRRTLYDIFSDTMAGVAGADPTAPPLQAFAQGATGARKSKKLRETDASATEDKAYEREGTDLERENTRQSMDLNRQKFDLQRQDSRIQRLKSLSEIAKTFDDSDEIDKMMLERLGNDTLRTDEEVIADWKKYKSRGAGSDKGAGRTIEEGKIYKGPNGEMAIGRGGKLVPIDPSEIPMM